MKKAGSIALSTCLLINAGSISASAEGTDTTEAGNEEYTQMISNMLEMIDMTKWQYNAADDVYYQEFAEKKYYEQYTTYIGNDVLIGSGATLMEGIKVGDGAIVLPCAVVVDDVEPYAMVSGVPAQRKKYRFTKEDRTFLLESQWWKLDKSWLEENWKALHDIEVFKNAYEHFKKGI